MGLGHSPSIVVDGLVFYIDPNNPNCYPGFGNTLYNIVNTSIGGTFVGYTANPIDNTENRSIYFDGSDDYIPIGSLGSFYTQGTISFWIKFQDVSASIRNPFSTNYGTTNNVNVLRFETAEVAGSLRVWLGNSSGSYSGLYYSNVGTNIWYNVVLTWNQTIANVSGYINGVLDNSNSSWTNWPSSFANIALGLGYSGRYFKGNIGQASIYNRALTATEILQNYNATKKKYMPEENIVTNGLVLKLDAGNINSYAGVGTVWNDLSGFGNTFYLINGPSFNSAKGGYISFDGSNDYARLHSLSTNLQSTTSFTVEMLFKFNNGNTSWKKLFGFLDTDNALEMWVEQAKFKDDTGLVSNKSFEYIDFTYMTYVVNSSEKRLYFNGVLDKSGSGYSLSLPTSYLGIASDIGRGYYCNMDVNLIQIYNRALTQQEISQNYNATKKRFVNALPPVRNGLVMELDAGQRSSYPGTGNTWYDLSGNGYNYILTNGPTFSGVGISSNIVFDGSNDRALAVNPISLGTLHTVSMIIKPSSSGVLFGDFAYNNTGYAFYSAGSTLYYAVSDYVSTSITLSGAWTMLTVTRNGTSIVFYQNGILLGSQTLGGNYPLTLRSIADFDGGGYAFTGSISQVSCFNRALSAYEVKQNFDFYRTRYNI